MLRAVLDPNVLVSAFITPDGTPARLLGLWALGLFELIVSPLLLNELSDSLGRPKFRRYASRTEATRFIVRLARAATVRPDVEEPPRLTRDEDDDYLIALARTVRADALVSGDHHLTELEDPPVPILSPRLFLDLLTGEPPPG